MESEAYFSNIQTAIDGGQIVSYRWLSETLAISSNDAKKLLFEYTEKHPENEIVYCVIGTMKNFSKIATLTTKSKLEKIKNSLNVVTSVHIYSVQKTIPKNSDILCTSECQLKTAGYQATCKNPQLLIEKAKQSAVHQQVELVEIKGKTKAPPAKQQEKPPPKKKEPVSARTAKTSAAPKTGGVLGKRKADTRSPSARKDAERPDMKKRLMGGFFPLAESGKLTKHQIEESQPFKVEESAAPAKKRRLTKTGADTLNEKDKEDVEMLWSDDEMKSPESPITFSSDSEEESPEEEVVASPAPVSISPKTSPFAKFQKNGNSPAGESKAKPIKAEGKVEEAGGYIVFRDDPEQPKARAEAPKRVTKTTNKPLATSKAKGAKPPPTKQKSLFSFFGK